MAAGKLRLDLSDLPIFQDLDGAALAAVERELEWFGLPGGWTLFEQGDEADGLYIVTYGQLGAYMSDGGGETRLVSHVLAGEIIGEVALLTGEPRTASLVALRDSELLRLTRRAFEELIERHPRVMFFVARQLVTRLRRADRGGAPDATPRTFMVAPLDPAARYQAFARGLVEALGGLGERVRLLDSGSTGEPTEWFHQVESAHDRIIYLADPQPSGWTQRCQRQADRILLVASGAKAPPARLTAGLPVHGAALQPMELVLLHEAGTSAPTGAVAWLDRLKVEHHAHCREGNRGDLERIARLLTRRAVGVVFSGGGARGIAHVGVIKALRAAGVPLDLAGGTSMGAIAAAGVALEWDDAALEALVQRTFTETNPFSDYTFPVVSVVRGRKVATLLRLEFADRFIENLWLPYFCVSSNLTLGKPYVHRRGPLWRALRASIAIPGLLPPVVEDGQVLVDGGMINNLPGDVMAALERGPVIGVDIGREMGLTGTVGDLDEKSLWWLLMHRDAGVPRIGSILMRSVTLSSDAQVMASRSRLRLLLQPKLGTYDPLDWKSYKRAIQIGYDSTMASLEQLDAAARTALHLA